MKKIIYILISFLVLSCTDKAINLDQKSSVSYSSAFNSAARCDLTVVGCYAYAQGTYRGIPFGSRSFFLSDVRGEDIASSSYFSTTYNSSFTTSSSDGDYHWTYLFRLINQANVVIEGLQEAQKKAIITEDNSASLQGEARFLRALALHEALIYFAQPYNYTSDASHYGVPAITYPCNTIESVAEASKAGRATVKQCYDEIISDLDYAEQNLPAQRTGTANLSRATKGAAIALKTRIYLHMGLWSKVIEEVNKLVPSTSPFKSSIGAYKLTDAVDGPFTDQQSSTESIFSIENSTISNPGMDGCLGQFYFGRKDLALSPILYNAIFWMADDLRRSQLLQIVDGKYYTKKYPKYVNMDDWAPIMRYAEVLLNGAEAVARVEGKSQRALDLLNAVRNRAVKNVSEQYTLASFKSSDDLVQAVLNERRIEFFAEGKRWYDIHRLSTDIKFSVKTSTGVSGIPKKVNFGSIKSTDYSIGEAIRAKLLTVSEIPATDRRFIFPIPQDEIDSNPVIAAQQNAGW